MDDMSKRSQLKTKPKSKTKLVKSQVSWNGFRARVSLVRCRSEPSGGARGNGGRKANSDISEPDFPVANSRPLFGVNLVNDEPPTGEIDQSSCPIRQRGFINRKSVGQVEKSSSICTLDEVAEKFIRLLRCNKLLNFYLGTLIYSVMNIAFTFYSNQTMMQTTVSSTSDKRLKSIDCKPEFYTQTLYSALLIVGGSLLALITLVTSLKFAASTAAAPRTNAQMKLLQSAGILLTLILLYLPLIASPNYAPEVAAEGADCAMGANQQTWLLGPHLLALTYLQPLLLEGGPLDARLICSLTLGPMLVLASVRLWLEQKQPSIGGDSAALSLVILLPTALLLGLLRRRQFVYTTTRSTFSGATQLIEAKVSLEHQRQQQETLLLSVLPAYVAEQVKRNMLKKTTSALVHLSDPLHAPSLTAAGVLGGGQSPLRALGQPTGPEQAGDAHLAPSACVGQARYQSSSKLALGFISETLLVSSPPFNKQQTLHQTISTNNLTPAARRGFNELYIRTYNNVSLLYGDIVGFTRLCTQLSSSQLVRVLNDLFSHFDHLAEKHKIMRIKILGDCYYGVSGIPEFAVMGAKSRAARNDNHAINCVNMGLDMIKYISCLNVERASEGLAKDPDSNSPIPPFELNMRIGIHTGHIHSGVIGLKKWQFDVWSNDVSIAMHSESSGIPGRVQVTQATLQHLKGSFTYENAPNAKLDPFLVANDIKTYLIKERVQLAACSTSVALLRGKKKFANSKIQLKSIGSNDLEVQDLKDEDNIRAATIGTIRQTLLANESCNSNSFSSYGLTFNHHDISSLMLAYRDSTIRKLYHQRLIDNSHLILQEFLSLLPLVVLILPLISFQLLLANQFAPVTIISLLLLLLLITFVSCNAREDSSTSEQVLEPDKKKLVADQFRLKRFLNKFALLVQQLFKPLITDQRKSRLKSATSILTLLTITMIQYYLIFRRFCAHQDFAKKNDSKTPEVIDFTLANQQHQISVILLLIFIDSSANLLSYKTKLCLISSVVCLQLVFIFRDSFQGFMCEVDETQLVNYGSRNQAAIDWSNGTLLLIMTLWSLAFARQLEYTNKANFLWRSRLNVDHEELEYISGINKVLLENILPSHVVQHYLKHPNGQLKSANQLPGLQAYTRMSFSNMTNVNNELYHEQHDSVAVMFASIPHFYEFYDESDISKQGLGCIALLNEIICDFDKLLLKNKFSRIEKIKTIGSTYMAAAGLRPCYLSGSRNSSCSQQQAATFSSFTSHIQSARFARSQSKASSSSHMALNARSGPILSFNASEAINSEDEQRLASSQQKLNLICIIQFATSLMTALNGINKQSFQVFKLRVGVNAGSVIAGVIGAQRPFYDIWGDCVNIASRMESLGEVGRIQVEERTAKLLMDSLCVDTYSIVRRGPIDVKGKGGMVTYFVDKKVSANEDQSVQQQHSLSSSNANQAHKTAESHRLQALVNGGQKEQEDGREDGTNMEQLSSSVGKLRNTGSKLVVEANDEQMPVAMSGARTCNSFGYTCEL